MEIKLPTKQILINNLTKIETYLHLSVHDCCHLLSLHLDKNIHVPGVEELLELIPDGYYSKEYLEFYNQTGLKLLAEVYKDNYEVFYVDKNEHRYPRIDLGLFNEKALSQLHEHPEWLSPQEEPDIIIRYIWPLNKNDEGIIDIPDDIYNDFNEDFLED